MEGGQNSKINQENFDKRDQKLIEQISEQEKYNAQLKKLLAVTSATNEEVLIVMGVEDSNRKQHKEDLNYLKYDPSLASEQRHHLSNLVLNNYEGVRLINESENFRDLLITYFHTFTKGIEENNRYQSGKILDLYKNFKAAFILNQKNYNKNISEISFNTLLKDFNEYKKLSPDGKGIEKKLLYLDDETDFILHEGDRLIVKSIIKLKGDVVAILEGSFDNENKENQINRFELLHLGQFIEELSIKFNQLYTKKYNLKSETKRETS